MLLSIKNLHVSLNKSNKQIPILEDLSFDLYPGECLGLVGESGSGKTMTALSILQLHRKDIFSFVRGEIVFQGKDLLKASTDELRSIRGKEISMVFQEPMTALNPVYMVGDQLKEVLTTHESSLTESARTGRILDMLNRVGLTDPEQQLRKFPHELSGGMRQRVLIAMALLCRPKILIADEPTTALDVTIQKQILDLLRSLQREFQMAVLLVTHDLGIVAQYSDRVAVMYGGKIQEVGETGAVLKAPAHPYTQGLLHSIPRGSRIAGSKLIPIPGNVPVAGHFPRGCHFSDRCTKVVDRCRNQDIPLEPFSERLVRCIEVSRSASK